MIKEHQTNYKMISGITRKPTDNDKGESSGPNMQAGSVVFLLVIEILEIFINECSIYGFLLKVIITIIRFGIYEIMASLNRRHSFLIFRGYRSFKETVNSVCM